MNKKHFVALSAAGIMSLCSLVGCSQNTSPLQIDGEDVIVSIENDVSKETYTANDLFGKYLSTTSGASAAFNAVYDVLIRKGVPITQEISNEVATQVAQIQQNANDNASSNGTTYNEELSKLLESNGADDLADLSKIKELGLQKSKFEDDYYDSQIFSGTMTDTISVTNPEDPFSDYYLSKEFIQNENPYHIRHILVKISASGNSFLPSAQTISADEAKKLGNTIKDLARPSLTYGEVARSYSDDGSVSSFGSLNEIMGRTTGYVDEFKFAVFQYDAYHNANVTNGSETLGIPEKVRLSGNTNSDDAENMVNTKDVLDECVNFIPFEVADQLIQYAETTTDSEGKNVRDGKDIYYPRNILFNHYFNNHGLSFIVKGNATVADNSNFRYLEGVSKSTEEKDKILCDENGRPILVTRAGTSGDEGYQGIHFILIENSPLVNEENLGKSGYSYSVEQELKYYSINVPRNNADISQDKRYVTFIDSQRGDYSDRASEIESAVKSYDSNINFRLYEKIFSVLKSDGYNITLDSRIKDSIEKYMTSTRARSALDRNENYESSWESYLRKLCAQLEFKSTEISLNVIKDFDSGFEPVVE